MELKSRHRESGQNSPKSNLIKDQINDCSNSPLRLLQPLQTYKLIISPMFLKQRGMVPALNHTASLKNVDAICVLDRAQAVGDDDCGAAFGDRV